MKLGRTAAFVLLSFCFFPGFLGAETPATTTTSTTTTPTNPVAEPTASQAAADAKKPVPYTAMEFPQWTLDLRRAEAIAFGSLPFSLFFSQFALDTYRCSQHNWDRNYAPWPLKSAGSVAMSQDEYVQLFAAACVGAVVIALVDFAIVAIKRTSRQKAVDERVKADYTVERSPSTPITVPQAAVPSEGDAETKVGER
ncbi:MAG: hypothetical protein WCT14_00390 [Treponemataceae bacterium]